VEETAVQPVRNGKAKAQDATTQEVKPRRQRQMRALSQMSSAEEMKDIAHSYKVDNLPTEWKNIPTFSMFSRSPDGSFPCVKSSKSSFIDLRRERQEMDIFAGSVYRLY
jgi:hypothetical protein